MSRPRLRARHQQFIVEWVGTAKRETRFSSTGVKEQPMIWSIMLTVAAVFCIALTKRGRPNAPALRKAYASRDSFDKFEMSANNLKAAVNKVDNSAAAVEIALKRLKAA
jgi:hypothetical protein